MLDLIFVKVENSMQLLSKIYAGCLFEYVKRTCMALSDPSAMHVHFTCSNKHPAYISLKSCMEFSTLTKIKSNMFP